MTKCSIFTITLKTDSVVDGWQKMAAEGFTGIMLMLIHDKHKVKQIPQKHVSFYADEFVIR